MGRFFIGLLAFFLCTGFGDPVYTTNKEGNAFFEQGRFDEALKAYSGGLSSESLDPRSDRLDYNLGNTAIKTGDYESAIKSLTLASRSKNKKLRNDAVFNRGYARIKGGDKAKKKGDLDSAGRMYKGAIADYRHLAGMDRVDEKAVYNLELATKKLKQLKQKQKQKKKEQKKKKDKDKKNKNKPKEGKEEKNDQGAPQKKDGDSGKKDGDNNQKKKGGDKPEESAGKNVAEKEKDKPKGLSKKQAEQVFNVIDEQEKKLRGKMKHGTGRPKDKKNDKDW